VLGLCVIDFLHKPILQIELNAIFRFRSTSFYRFVLQFKYDKIYLTTETIFHFKQERTTELI